jgi:hypothetical protein
MLTRTIQKLYENKKGTRLLPNGFCSSRQMIDPNGTRQSRDVTAAIIGRLRQTRAEPGQPVVMYEIRVPLVGAGYDQHEIVNALTRR